MGYASIISFLCRYFGTMAHLFKANIGSGLFAMGDAYKNAGLAVGFVITFILGMICLHTQRLLVKCSKKMSERYEMDKCPGYAETVELCFLNGPMPLRKWARTFKISVNVSTCMTQFGICCVYFVFLSDALKQVNFYRIWTD